MEKENKMGVMPIPRLMISMAVPLMVSLLVQSLYNIVDGIFVSRISEEAFTATSLAYPVQLLMVAVSVGTGVGVNSVVSRMLGAKKQEEANQAATTGLVLALVGAAVFMIFGAFFLKDYIRLLSGSANALDMCERYLRICTIFCAGVFLETLGQRLLQAVGNTVLSMVSLIVGALTNIILDPILIFSCHMGIEGAAVATVIGQLLGAAIALGFNIVLNHEVRFSFKKFRLKKEIVWPIYQVGLPTIVTQAMGSIMLFSVNGILGLLLSGYGSDGVALSTPAIAFFGAYYKLQSFLYMPVMGLGQAAIPIVGYNYGAGKGDRVRRVLWTEIPIAVAYMLIGLLIFEILPGPLLSLFAASDAALAIGIPGLRVISATFVFGGVTTVLGYTCSGLGNGVVNMIGTALRQFLILVPLAYLFGRLGGVHAIWYAFWVSETIAVGYSILNTRFEINRKVKPIEQNQS